MSKDPNKRMTPPVPRDHDQASLSELMPFRSKNVKLLKSPLFIFMIIAGLISTFMFGALGAILGRPGPQSFAVFQLFVTLSIFVILMLTLLGIYAYSRMDRPIWPFMLAFLITAIQAATPIFNLYVIVFRKILPGDIDPTAKMPFIQAFIGMLFGAGLLEELLKAVTILLGAYLTIYALKKTPALANNAFFKLFHVRGPLDGVVFGLFAGAGFIMSETAFQYVPDLAMKIIGGTGDYGSGIAAGMLLLIPRTLGGAVGHMAYSAIFGYFIGLAVLRPKQMWMLIGIGYAASSVIHALWNSVGQINPNLNYVVAVVSAIGAGACLLKARQIEATVYGRENLTGGSIIVDRPPVAPRPVAQPVHNPGPAPAKRPSADQPLALDIDGMTLPLRGGAVLDLGAEPALGGRGQGVTGQVVPHPSRAHVLGLRNSGTIAWTARLRDGSQQVIEQNQNIRLAPGVQIDFGGGLTGRVVPLG
ncbi:MAG TPA: PrsW family glutamic-type intramembrane protease [Caulobacter sp.]|nr:PrsW family glutamic-type intramembrane protease [Caulobacter sp.]